MYTIIAEYLIITDNKRLYVSYNLFRELRLY